MWRVVTVTLAMHGKIHCTIKNLVMEKFDHKIWNKIIEKSGLDEEKHFMMFTYYQDSLTLQLLQAISDITEVPLETLLKTFGSYFIKHCLQHGYDKTLMTLGSDFFTFIQNLDSLHALLSATYKYMNSPSFRCEQDEDGDLLVHYYSHKEGLHPFVIGLLEAVCKEIFHYEANITVISQSTEEISASVTQFYTRFLVKVETTQGGPSRVSTVLAPRHRPIPVDSKTSIIKPEDLCMALPYHIALDRDMLVRQCGDNIRRIAAVHIRDSMPLARIGEIVKPVMTQTMDNIFKFINSVFILAIYRKSDDRSNPFLLKGHMIWMEQSDVMMFIGSPHVSSLDEMIKKKVFLDDIPIYDATRELVLLNQKRIAEIDVAIALDKTTAELQRTSKALEVEKQKTEDLLLMMLPEKVAISLTQGIAVKAEKFEISTVLFSDIVTFTNIAACCNPMEIVSMLNDLFHRLDSQSNIHGVYKVETIGDAYMGVAGVPEIQDDHAERIADFAMDILEVSSKVISPATGLPLQVRVGVHSGPVVAGVVGKKMPRYCLFGDTVNTASRMESQSMPGRIHMSQTVHGFLYNYGYVMKRRGEVNIKGKGSMITFFLVGKLNRRVKEPHDEFINLPEEVCPRPIIKQHLVHKHQTTERKRKSFSFLRTSVDSTTSLLALSLCTVAEEQGSSGVVSETDVDTGHVDTDQSDQ